jgi:antitoxin CptB
MGRLQRERLKWKCRRGLLELDLVLQKYLKENPEDEELAALLDLSDNDLWDVVSGRSERFAPGLEGVVARLRAV